MKKLLLSLLIGLVLSFGASRQASAQAYPPYCAYYSTWDSFGFDTFNVPTVAGPYLKVQTADLASCPQQMIVRIAIDGQSWVLADDVEVRWFY